ncbi:hypothetical protein [Congregibacter litoralis]|uniref:Type II secretion system protein GspC N-terminal domain-containing protein n=1 Tax=Congregibacter litoralis KT71 TaxID=314285 RepID=A4A5L9_9GAMM|nr:hypothetical protein [Congregibacter litoralis]EAQ98316.1 hypothetical protein KT71_00025 [Congregibacter litoralis KT71]
MTVIATIRDRYVDQAEPQRSERRLELVVIVMVLLIALQGVGWYLMHLSKVKVPAVAPADDSLRVIAVNAPQAITAPQSMQLQARPLFWASRRPNANVAVQPSPDASGKPARRLEGLQVAGAVGAGEEGKAIVIYKDKLMRLGIGDRVAGWSLQSVSLGEVIFVSAGIRDVRRLTPRPVIPAQRDAPEPARAAEDEVVRATPAKTAVPQSAAKTARKNNKTTDKLSLGGQ